MSAGQYGPPDRYPWWLMLCWVGSAHFQGRKPIAQIAVLAGSNYIIISQSKVGFYVAIFDHGIFS